MTDIDTDEMRRLGSDQFGSITGMRLTAAAAEIDRLRHRLAHFERLREVNRKNWIEAAQVAIDRGDFRPLKLRVDLSKAGPIEMTEQHQK